MYADYNHPRLGGLGGTEMDWLRTTTGRHCMTGGLGEQVVRLQLLFNIGSVIYGKRNKYLNLVDMAQVVVWGNSLKSFLGITNYFKFIKWCFWVFVVLTVLYLPVLILNTFGRGDQQSVRLNSLSQTMVGFLFFLRTNTP